MQACPGDYRRLSALIPDDVPVLLHAVIPIMESKTAETFGKNWLGANAKVDKLNEEIQAIATENGWGFLQFKLSDTHFSDDGIHLSNDGYSLWIEKLRDYLNKPELQQ